MTFHVGSGGANSQIGGEGIMEGEGFLPAVWTRLKESVGQRWTRKPRRKKVVLVVENNRSLRKLLAEVLQEQCQYTIEAGDGAEAVRIGARYRD